jgi:CheY-like chemotaxis protein
VDAPRTLPGGIVLNGPELESLRRRFLEEGILQSRQLVENLDRFIDIPQAIRMARSWTEGAQVLDYPALAFLAAEAETFLRVPHPDPVQLCDAISNVMLAFAEPPEAAIGPIPDEIARLLKGKSIALVGFADDEAERLCGILDRASARPRLFDAAKTPESDAISACVAIMVHVRAETLGTHWLHPLTVSELRQPLLLVGLREHILDLEASVVPRATELLIDGWQPEEAILRLGHCISRAALIKQQTPAPAPVVAESANGRMLPAIPMPRAIAHDSEVLIADDDMTVRMVVRAAIQGSGIKCRMACDGAEALQMIRDCNPPAAILDVNMPGMDGYEVLAAARNEGLPVRIILLTARQQEADITRGFNLGADDYIVKPFNPAELLARLKRFL